MIFGNDRDRLRRMYHEAWQKRRNGEPASALDVQIADIVELHPEYHPTIEGDEVAKDFLPDGGESNPYLHMGLHLGLREQVTTDRPAGIRKIHGELAARLGDLHDAEHRMIECLAETLWEAQRDNTAPDELRYLERLRNL